MRSIIKAMIDLRHDVTTETGQQKFIKHVKQLAKDPEMKNIMKRMLEAELKTIKNLGLNS
jgi:hypothetical protein